MRMFIAIPIPEEVSAYLKQVQGLIQKLRPRVNYVRDFHLTLQFIGDVQPEDVEKIKKGLAQVVFSPFNLALKDIGFFPEQGDIRVLWAGLVSDLHVVALREEILTKLLLFSEDKNFHAHITLGRVKFIRKMPGFKDYLKTIKVKRLKFSVDTFQLLKSTLTTQGPVHEVIEEYSANKGVLIPISL